MSIRRAEGWEQRYAEVLDHLRGAPFAWGSHDCATLAFDVLHALTGQRLDGFFRGRYSTEEGSARVLADLFGGGLAVAAHKYFPSIGFPQVRVPLARRGDPVMARTSLGAGLGAVSLDGRHVVAVHPRVGWELVPLDPSWVAWAVLD